MASAAKDPKLVDVSDRLDLIELINKLFTYTDSREWKELINEVFCDTINLDYDSLWTGSGKRLGVGKEDVTKEWDSILGKLDCTMHSVTNTIVYLDRKPDIDSWSNKDGSNKDEVTKAFDDKNVCRNATIRCYAKADHYFKKNFWTCAGSYTLTAVKFNDSKEWRVKSNRFDLKFEQGMAKEDLFILCGAFPNPATAKDEAESKKDT